MPGWNTNKPYYNLISTHIGNNTKSGFNIFDSAASMSQLKGDFGDNQFGNQWGIELSRNRGTSSHAFQYRTRDGLVVGFANIIGFGKQKFGDKSSYWRAQFACLNNEANCREIEPMLLCIGNDRVKLNSFRSGTAGSGTILSYEGKCNN